ncbi:MULTISPECIES: S1 family peptidase [Flavobacterium]|uniref:Serine protease n=1 Tax=Flavobacterium quisquiliarum TaxID=1834436 RepID=A0ABV8W1X6_9FLAO|nr:serine protease [Flavobacterium quisquiliarum]MBW1658612.1 serine protease [Flavobacterium quisquiliarum]
MRKDFSDNTSAHISISDLISSSTVKIETFDKNGGIGTGFFFDFNPQTPETMDSLAIVTNWHVVEEVENGQFTLTKKDQNGEPLNTEHLTIFLENFESHWTPHPDPEIDLCILPIKSIMHLIKEDFFYTSFDASLIPSQEEIDSLCAIEEIIMLGYPDALWDSHNNKPIARKGITATNPRLPYCGYEEFLIDAASIPGSSGSPILIYNIGQYLDRNDNHYFVKYRLFLLGILYEGPQFTAEGKIERVKIKKKKIVTTQIPINLGAAINSCKILDFEKLV